jgi:hypothetical protein
VSNVLKNNFFTISRELVDGGHLAKLSGSAVKLYISLMMLAQKHSAVEIEIPAYTGRALAGLAPNSITTASRELAAAGLVTSKTGQYGRKVYVLLEPRTQFPLPPPAGHKGIFRQQPVIGGWTKSKKLKTTSSVEIQIPSWEQLGTEKVGAQGYPNNCEASSASGSKGSRTDISNMGSGNPTSWESHTLQTAEKVGLGLDPDSLKTSLKKEFSKGTESPYVTSLPLCRSCGSFYLCPEPSGSMTCETCGHTSYGASRAATQTG